LTSKELIVVPGETVITVVGNLTADPELRFIPVLREFTNSDGVAAGN
jgi:single-strand DNA-binding protein